MKFNHIATALIVGALCSPVAMAKAKSGARAKSGLVHVGKSKKGVMTKAGSSTTGKIRKPRKPAKPVFQPGTGAEL